MAFCQRSSARHRSHRRATVTIIWDSWKEGRKGGTARMDLSTTFRISNRFWPATTYLIFMYILHDRLWDRKNVQFYSCTNLSLPKILLFHLAQSLVHSFPSGIATALICLQRLLEFRIFGCLFSSCSSCRSKQAKPKTGIPEVNPKCQRATIYRWVRH